MTANVDIKRGDLHLAVSEAFNRGRYVLMTGGGDGAPIEITIDLRERPDDGFLDLPTLDELTDGDIGRGQPFPTDDHGPTIPAQDAEHHGLERTGADAVTFYEVQIQALARSARGHGFELTLENVTLEDVFRWGDTQGRAKDCAFIHVYDRVTRERRTLKRPAPDAVLTGLRDVAADLRAKATGYPFDQPGVTVACGWVPGDLAKCIVATREHQVGRLYTVTCVDKAGGFLGFTGDGATYSASKFEPHVSVRGAPVEPPFGCAPVDPTSKP